MVQKKEGAMLDELTRGGIERHVNDRAGIIVYCADFVCAGHGPFWESIQLATVSRPFLS